MTINLTFDGWARNTAITIRWYETESVSSPSVVLGTVMTDNFGHAAFSFTVPEAAAKFHRLESVGGGNVRWGNFYIQTSMLLSPMQAPAGANVALTLRGFGANEQIELRFFTNTADYIVLTTLTADSNGSVNTTFAVPASTKGIHKIQTFGLTSGVQALRWFYLT